MPSFREEKGPIQHLLMKGSIFARTDKHTQGPGAGATRHLEGCGSNLAWGGRSLWWQTKCTWSSPYCNLNKSTKVFEPNTFLSSYVIYHQIVLVTLCYQYLFRDFFVNANHGVEGYIVLYNGRLDNKWRELNYLLEKERSSISCLAFVCLLPLLSFITRPATY